MPSKTERTTISIRGNTLRRAEALMEKLDMDFSGLIQKLILDDYERRHGPLTFDDAERPLQALPAKPPITPPRKSKAKSVLKKAASSIG